MKTRSAFLVLMLCCAAPLVAQSESLDAMLARVQKLIAAKDFGAAETLAKRAVDRNPHSRAARSTLAWVTLWNGRYDSARTQFRELLSTNAHDASALLGLADAEYWSGNLRDAQRDFTEVLRIDSHNAEARRALAEIDAATQPGFVAGIDGISDDQPYRTAAARATVYGFTNPNTKWLVSAMRQTATASNVVRGADATSLSAGLETRHASAALKLFRFPDNTTKLLPRISFTQNVSSTTLTATAERYELLRAAPALRTHPTATSFSIRWSRDDVKRTQFAVRAEHLSYFDHNSGVAADAYVLVPFRTYAFGASAAYRDTDESRFNGVAYDPYYTPQRLREVRLIAAAQWRVSRATVDVHLDGGTARDRLDSFTRTFHPWRALIGAAIPINDRLTFNAGVEHNVTIYYTANEFRTSVAGRF